MRHGLGYPAWLSLQGSLGHSTPRNKSNKLDLAELSLLIFNGNGYQTHAAPGEQVIYAFYDGHQDVNRF